MVVVGGGLHTKIRTETISKSVDLQVVSSLEVLLSNLF